MTILRIFIFSFLFVMSSMASSAKTSRTDNYSLYLAAGQNFIFPTSIRFGWGSWEAGILSQGFYGFNKTFPISGSSLYSSFGFGLNGDGNPTNIGFQSAAGANFDLFFGIELRMEMFAMANLNGKLSSQGLLGLSYVF